MNDSGGIQVALETLQWSLKFWGKKTNKIWPNNVANTALNIRELLVVQQNKAG